MRPDLIFAPPEPCRTLTESKARTTRSRVRAGRWDAIAEICCCSATNPGGVCALRQFSVHEVPMAAPKSPGGAGGVLLKQIDFGVRVTPLPKVGEIENPWASADHGDTHDLHPLT